MRRTLLVSLCPILLALFACACGEEDGSPSSPSAGATSGAKTAGGVIASTDPSLTAPTTQSPPIGESVLDLQPELVIGNATGGSGTRTYTVDLALDSAFLTIALTETGISEGLGGITKWRVTEPLEPDTKYFWRVAAVTSAGAGPYSAVSEFRVREPFKADRPTGSLVVFDPLPTVLRSERSWGNASSRRLAAPDEPGLPALPDPDASEVDASSSPPPT